MIKFAIYEKDRRFLEIVRNKLYETICKNKFNARITPLDDTAAALDSIEREPYDVMFISISESDSSGFEIAAKAREKSRDTIIVFGSESEKLLFKSMDYQPFNLVIKSLTDKKEQMNAELERITVMIACRFNQSRYISVGDNMIQIDKIGYIKSSGHYLEYHCRGSVLTVRENISDAEKRLCNCDFLRIHRQYIVNMAYIKRFYPTAQQITLINGEMLPVSRAKRSEIAEEYSNFKQNHNRI